MKKLLIPIVLSMVPLFPVKAQEFFQVTADTLIYYFNESFDIWEDAMQANGFELMPGMESLPRRGEEGGRLYAMGPTLKNSGHYVGISQILSKTDQLVSVHFCNYENEERYLDYLFEEIISQGNFMGRDNDLEIYLYKGYLFGLQDEDGIPMQGVLIKPRGILYH